MKTTTKRKYLSIIGLCLILISTAAFNDECGQAEQPTSSSGVKMTSEKVEIQSDGRTVEQSQVAGRINQDNKPGSIKHLYIISAYSGQVLIYSTVKGKVTSSGKRLTPKTISSDAGAVINNTASHCSDGMSVWIGNRWYCTKEVIQDDGTFGDSVEYLYWFDSKGIYHQHFPSGGQIVHVSSEPIAAKSVVINLETSNQ